MTQDKKTEAREWWIDQSDIHDGDLPLALPEHPKQGPLNWQYQLVHVIEYSAYQKLRDENEALRKRLVSSNWFLTKMKDFISHFEDCNNEDLEDGDISCDCGLDRFAHDAHLCRSINNEVLAKYPRGEK